jgi:alpha-tubulin suppressor-like RCC1 family protein
MKNALVILTAIVLANCGDATMPGADRHYIDVATGGQHTCAIAEDLSAYCWGRGADGELGTGTTSDEMFPAAVNTTLRFKKITAGAAHTCAIATDDRAYCWGWNVFYQIGDSTTTQRLTPSPVAFDLKYKDISAGDHHTCGVTTDSKVYCWGYNRFGQAGNGSTQVTIYPVQVTNDLRAATVSAGGHHTCTISNAGGAYCWGSNEMGQLGIGSDRAFSADPTAVVGGAQFGMVDAGSDHTCAVDIALLAYCWGDNEFGQLGDQGVWRNGLAGPATPVRVFNFENVESISAGTDHTCAINGNGRMWCWGRGTYGQLAIGTSSDHAVAQPVVFQPGVQNQTDYLRFVKAATGGLTHACGLGEGVVFCWGNGRRGELGSRTMFVSLPQRVE